MKTHINNKNVILQTFPPAEKYDEYTVSEIFPEERVSATSIGSSWILPQCFVSSMDDATLWTETCRDKRERGFKLVVLVYLRDSLSDTTEVSTEDPSNFVKSKPDAWSSLYEPSANIFAWKNMYLSISY